MPRAALSLAVLVVATAPLLTGAQPEQRDAAADAAQRIKQLQQEADALAQQASTLIGELRRLDLQRQIKAEELKQADAAVVGAQRAIEQGAARLAQLESERQQETPWVREHLVELYKRGRGRYLRVLLATGDIRSIARSSRGVAAMMTLDRVRLAEHRETLEQQREAVAALDAQRVKAESARRAAQQARAALERAAAAHNERLDQLDRQRDTAARYIGELQAAQHALQRSALTLPGNAPVLPIGPWKGQLEWPAAGRLLSPFGRSTTERFGSTVSRNGIEIEASEEAVVRAVHPGTVSFAAPFSGFGTLVVLDHGQNTFTLYGHLSQAVVTKGARVGRNEVVGHAGRTPDGVSAAYFELRIDGRPVDPVQWLRSQR